MHDWGGVLSLHGDVLDVLTLRGDRIVDVTGFLAPWVFERFGEVPGSMTPATFRRFGLPDELPA